VFLISTVIGFALLIAMLWIAGPMSVLARINALGVGGFAVFLLTLLLSFSLRVGGWRVLLLSYGVGGSLRRIFGVMAGAYAVTYLTPSFHLGGDPVRAFSASKGFTQRSHEVVATILIEKLLYAIPIGLLLFAGASVGLRSGMIPEPIRPWIILLAGTILVGSGIVLVGIARQATWASQLVAFIFRHLPQWSWVEHAKESLNQVERELNKALWEHRRAILKAAVLFSFSVGLNVLAPLIFVYFTYGRLLSVGELLLFFTLSTAFSLFSWLTPGGIGIMEGAYAAVFGILRLPVDSAVAFSLLLRTASLCIVGFGITHHTRSTGSWFARRERKGGVV